MKMKLNQEDKIEYSSRINLLNTGGSCSCIKFRLKEERNNKERDSLGIYSTLTGSLLIFKIMRNFGMHSNEIMKN